MHLLLRLRPALVGPLVEPLNLEASTVDGLLASLLVTSPLLGAAKPDDPVTLGRTELWSLVGLEDFGGCAGAPGRGPAAGIPQIGAGDVTIRGVSLRVAPADPTDQLIRPHNAPVILATKVEDGAGSDVSSDQLFLDAVV